LKTLISSVKNNHLLNNSNFLATSLIIFLSTSLFIIDRWKTNNNLIIPVILTIFSTNLITKWSIKRLKSVQLKQTIREEGPKTHIKKSGTPTMGGITIIPSSLIIGILVNINQGINKELIAISILGIGFMAIGVVDDYLSIFNKKNRGLKPNEKIFLQLVITIFFLFFSFSNNLISSQVSIFNNQSIQLNNLIWPLATFIIIAESNATNLTDGLDGLATGCGAIVLAGLGMELIIRGNPNDMQLASLCLVMSGGWLGFLLNNKNPAKIFMGDAGSLAMGSLLAGLALISNTLYGLLIMGIVFLAESLSVIIQVIFFKISKSINGKGYRIFKMAPLHHHFELSGLNEITIVRNFWIISISFVLLRLLFLEK